LTFDNNTIEVTKSD